PLLTVVITGCLKEIGITFSRQCLKPGYFPKKAFSAMLLPWTFLNCVHPGELPEATVCQTPVVAVTDSHINIPLTEVEDIGLKIQMADRLDLSKIICRQLILRMKPPIKPISELMHVCSEA